MNDGFVVVAEFSVAPDARARFLDLVRRNADASVRNEPGCRRFDVLVPEQDGPVVLYEIYDTPEAFETHLATSHYAAFRDAIQDLSSSTVVRRFALDEHIKPKPPA
jgi:autoinducer 2-degrading protein